MKDKKVKVYSTKTCLYCEMVKDFFDEKGVQYEDIDVNEDADKRNYIVEKTEQMGVPVVEIGENFVVGFDKDKLSELLGLT